MNTAVALASLASATAVVSPSIASSDDQSIGAEQLARFEQMIDLLRTRHVCEGWRLDEEAAERVLRFFRTSVRFPKTYENDPGYDDEWMFAIGFIRDHGQSFDWILAGDIGSMICGAAARSAAAAANAGDEPVLAAIERHRQVNEAFLWTLAETSRLQRELPAETRQWHCQSLQGEKSPPEETTDAREWIAAELAADAAGTAECRALCDLVSTVPTTAAGAAALIAYTRNLDELSETFSGEYDPDGVALYVHTGDALLESLETWISAAAA